MNINIATIEDVLKLKAVVKLEAPTHGFWDGGAKSEFEFKPEIERTPGVPAIHWGSYAANLWFVIPFKTGKQHLGALRRKLKGKPARTISIA